MQQIEQEVRQFVVDNFVLSADDGDFADDDSFLEKGMIDSMGILSLITFVEQQYAVAVNESELITENWDSVERVAKFVRSKQQAMMA